MPSYILREWFVTSGLHLGLMACAMVMSFPSVLAPALTRNHSQIVVTDHELNSIMGAYGTFSSLGFITGPIVMQKYGRKATNIFFSICVIIGSITIALATNVTFLIVGRAIHGMTLAVYLIGCIIAAEYTHPKRRGFHMIIKGVSGGIGELLCHSLGLSILTYRQTTLLAIVPAILSIMLTLKWPESPQYLTCKGRYEECIAAFEWLRGTDIEAKKELQELIRSHKERDRNYKTDRITRFKEAFLAKTLWMPMFITLLVDVACHCSGFFFMASYITEIINKMTADRNKAYYNSLAVDVLKILSVAISSIIVRLFKRRTLLLSSGVTACIFMVVISILYYFDKTGSISVKWITSSIFVVYYVIVNMLIAPACTVIMSELIPFKYKGIGTLVSGMVLMITTTLVMTFTWKIISVLDLHGAFAIYVVICAICYITLYFLMPETKDKTLQDIGNEFANKNVAHDEENEDVAMKLNICNK